MSLEGLFAEIKGWVGFVASSKILAEIKEFGATSLPEENDLELREECGLEKMESSRVEGRG